MRKIKTTLEEANEAHSYKWLFPITLPDTCKLVSRRVNIMTVGCIPNLYSRMLIATKRLQRLIILLYRPK